MRPAFADQIKWYTIGFGFLAGTCLLWPWSEAGLVQSNILLLSQRRIANLAAFCAISDETRVLESRRRSLA